MGGDNCMQKKCILVGLINCKNFGDKVIFKCSETLLKKYSSDEYINLDLNLQLPIFKKITRKIIHKIINKDKYLSYQVKIYEELFDTYINDVDKIIFVGGGIIKFKYQLFWAQISAIINIASRKNISVFFNAVGVEGYDENDKKCQILKESLNKPCVKLITVRDDIDLLQKKYIEKDNNSVSSYKVADPAVFTQSVFKISKQNNSKIIGIGLIRSEIFKDNDVFFSKHQLLSLYVDLIKLIQSYGLKFQLFINGFDNDLELLDEICIACNLDKNSIKIPKNEVELVRIISEFNFVISARLHACIIAYSLGIPAIGLLWNDKLKMLGENIGHSERFVTIDNLNGKYIFDLYLRE